MCVVSAECQLSTWGFFWRDGWRSECFRSSEICFYRCG